MKVVFTPAARRDVLLHAVYLAHESFPSVAARFIDAVKRSLAVLAQNPRMGPAVHAPQLHGIRRWPVKGFPVIWIY
jgi:plasmid stabilization system protein ParE